MRNIADVDPNFRVCNQINKPDAAFYNPQEKPFRIHGVFHEDGKFRRLPESVASATSADVHFLHANTAGGRLRFQTDSPYVILAAGMENICKMSHFAMTGSAGFDLYAGEDDQCRYIGSFRPPLELEDGYQSIVELGEAKMRQITIHFPLYSDVKRLFIGLAEDASVQEPLPYRVETPAVYYGSSITQGGCASRPGNAYSNILSRRCSIDHVNLGFSGSAKGEDAIADYISSLEMSLFVYDYDHNAPTAAHLAATHEKMFRKIRSHQPELPVIFLSRPRSVLNEDEWARLRIVEETYRRALAEGDRNVYFIPGPELMEEAGSDGTVDLNHPNDLGFHSMAARLKTCIDGIL